MSPASGQLTVQPPWQHPQFLSEEGLRAAQDYYFRTHATHTQMIAQGRSAQGLSKSLLRRKLSKEMGEDFKMFTGQSIGDSAGSQDISSLGIRGELNALLLHIYQRIAPGQPITSPVQEDLTILKHPHGSLEVCYAMTFYYGSLLRQYASFAANRRKVLKSLMDEELFKWIWRMVIGFMMQPEEAKLDREPAHLAAGLAFIPVEQQQVGYGAKLYEIGMFLLSKTLQESQLRLPLCYYYTIFLRQLQTLLALQSPRQELDDVYSLLTRRIEGEPVDDVLVGIDALFNSKGNAMESFDDVVSNQELLAPHIPAEEFAFINQFEDFGNPQRLAATLKRLVPDVRREAIEGQETSLMPLLLAMRVVPLSLRDAVLGALPIPLLIMLRNLIANSAQDDTAASLLDAIRAGMEARRGEKISVQGQSTGGRGAVATSVRVAPPAGQPVAAESVRPAADRPAPAPRVEPPAGTASDRPAAAPRVAPPAGTPVAKPKTAEADYLELPSLLAWRLDNGRLAAISLSAGELFELVGPEPRFLVPWVVFTLRSGQVFGLEPEAVTKDRVSQIVQALRRSAGPRTGSLAPDKVAKVLEEQHGASHAKLLLALVRVVGTRPYLRAPEQMAPALAGLTQRLGDRMMDFMRAPNDEAFREQRETMPSEERQVFNLLRRVAKSQ